MNALLKKPLILTTAITAALLTGCATGPDAQTGTVVGGILGAATGGIVGHQSGRGLEGAAIGGGLGAIAGNIFGNAQEHQAKLRATQIPAGTGICPLLFGAENCGLPYRAAPLSHHDRRDQTHLRNLR